MWDFYYTYRDNANWLVRKVMQRQMHKIRVWDKCAADRVDYFIANSHYIAQRIKKYYRRDSDVIYPCCHINESPFVEKEDFYLTVGRLTWQSIYDAVQALETSGPVVRVVGLTSPTRTLRPGDSGPEILQLNRLLLFLNQWIPEINFLAGTEPSDTFDSELELSLIHISEPTRH